MASRRRRQFALSRRTPKLKSKTFKAALPMYSCHLLRSMPGALMQASGHVCRPNASHSLTNDLVVDQTRQHIELDMRHDVFLGSCRPFKFTFRFLKCLRDDEASWHPADAISEQLQLSTTCYRVAAFGPETALLGH
jgi:hypothetical protein